MRYLFLLVVVGLFVTLPFPTATAPAAPPNGDLVSDRSEPLETRIPDLRQYQADALEGLAGDPTLPVWQREFVQDLLGGAMAQPLVTGNLRHLSAPETDGAWQLVIPPVGRADHTAIYDPVRDRMIVLGGYKSDSPNYLNDVWALTLGATPTWTELTPTGTPPTARRSHTAIYDPVRGRMIVFGGVASTAPTYRNDVWALSLGDDPKWTQLTPTGTPPSGRRGHTAIYDPVRDRMVVFGGLVSTTPNYVNDVWALSLGDNPAWTELTPTGTPPSARADHTANYDPIQDRMVVFGGSNGTYWNDAWALSLGVTPAWTELTPTGTPPSARAEHTAIYDSVQNRIVVFGEWDDHIALINEVWALSLGATPGWTELPPTGTRASGRWSHTAIYDPIQERMVVYGGYPNYANDVWAFSLDGSSTWTELPPLGKAPAGRWFHTAIYDPVRDRMIDSGGYPQNVHDVWTLALGGHPDWTRLNPSGTPPTGRKNHSAIYDPIRDRMVIFGGFLTYPDDVGLQLYLNDVWTLSLGDNPTWTQLSPAGPIPTERDEHTAIYDPLRDRMIVFGGNNGRTWSDVWALSLGGNPTWTDITPAGPSPSPRRRHNAIYDPIRDRMVVFGGFDTPGVSCVNDVWALSLAGTPAWTELTPSGTPPSPRGRQAAVYDPLRDRMVMCGGYDCSYHFLNDVWALSLGDNPAWQQLAPTGTSPSVRGGHSTIYDPLRDQMVMFGGSGSNQLNDVWVLFWGSGSCAIPEIVSYDPSVLTSSNCSGGCMVDFVVDTQDDYSGVNKITLERYLDGTWISVDSLLAPLAAPTWTLSCPIDGHYTDGEHMFHVVFHCDGSRGVSQTVMVLADRGVPVGIRGFEPVYSKDGVVLQWSVTDGLAIQGFNIYKSSRGGAGFERINAKLLSPDERHEYTDRDVRPGRTYWYRLGAVDADGEWMSAAASITVPGALITLYQNVPNPFNPTTSIRFVLPDRAEATLSIYDVEGRHVRTLVTGVLEAGERNVVWDGTDAQGKRVGSGIYFYRLSVGNKTLMKKMVLLK